MIDLDAEREHFIATLGMEHWLEGDVGRGRATVTEYVSAAPGWPSVSVMLTWADVLVGLLSTEITAPRVSITSSLSTHLTRQVPLGTELDLTGTLTKVGRSVTIGETVVRTAGDDDVLAIAIAVFQASPRPQDVTPASLNRFRGRQVKKSEHPTFADQVGLRVLEPGTAEISLRPDLTNSTESLQGGLVALLGESAAQSAATAALGAPAVVDSIEVHYLSACRIGPFRAEATELGSGLMRVEVRDPGKDNRIASVMVARTRPASDPDRAS